MLVYDINWLLQAACPSHLTLCVPPQVSHADLACGGQQFSSGGAIWAVVEAHHLPLAGIVEGLV